MSRPRRFGLRAILTALLTCLALLAAGGQALAHNDSDPAVPSNEDIGDHDWSFNGCSTPGATIDSVPGVFDFGHACIHHDGCYQGLDRSGDPATISRLSCDNTFRVDMRASCVEMHGSNLRATRNGSRCLDNANTYYLGVRLFGARFYSGTGSPL